MGFLAKWSSVADVSEDPGASIFRVLEFCTVSKSVDGMDSDDGFLCFVDRAS